MSLPHFVKRRHQVASGLLALSCLLSCSSTTVPYSGLTLTADRNYSQTTAFGTGLPLPIPEERIPTDSGALSLQDRGGIFMEDNIILLSFKPQTTRAQAQAILDSVNAQIVGGIDAYGLYTLKVPKQDAFDGLARLIARLKAQPEVSHANYNQLYFAHQVNVPDDPEFKDHWEVNDPLCQKDCDLPSGKNWWLEMVQAPLAWGIQTGRSDVPVGVIDTGFESHEDLNLTFNNEMARDSHGLIVAGIIGAQSNQRGVVGINWRAPIRAASGENGTASFEVIVSQLRDMMENHNIRLFNLSLGMAHPDSNGNRCRVVPDDLDELIEANRGFLDNVIQDVIEHDALIIQAAGNCGTNPSLENAAYSGIFAAHANEADYRDHVMIVAAANIAYQKTNYSQWGEGISVVAPGGGDSQRTEDPTDPHVFTTIPNNQYGSHVTERRRVLWWEEERLLSTNAGTSFAAPVVTGIASLIMAENPSLKASEIKDVIERGAQASGREPIQHNGVERYLVDAYQSLLLANEASGGRSAIRVVIE